MPAGSSDISLKKINNISTLILVGLKASLPFVLDKKSGILKFNNKEFKQRDFLKLIDTPESSIWQLDSQANEFTYVQLKVKVNDLDAKKSEYAYLYPKVNLKRIMDEVKIEMLSDSDSDWKVAYNFEIKDFQNSEFEMIDHDSKTNTFNFLLKESVSPNTILAQLVTFVNSVKTKNLVEDFHLVSVSDALPSKFDVDAFLKYDSLNGTIKLIRKINFANVRHLNFSLVGPKSLTENTTKNHQIHVNIRIKDSLEYPPEIELSEQEIKNGQNLILLSVGDLRENELVEKLSTIVSSTPPPMRDPRPAIPELNVESMPADYPRPESLYDEINLNRRNLNAFNKELVIKAYKYANSDDEGQAISNQENVKVRFLPNATSKYIIDRFEVKNNGTHLFFSKKNSSDFEAHTTSIKGN